MQVFRACLGRSASGMKRSLNFETFLRHAMRFRGPGRGSLGAKRPNVSKKYRKSRLQKVRKSLENGLKSPTKAPREFFETFWRLFGFWPRDSLSQVDGTSRHAKEGGNFKGLQCVVDRYQCWTLRNQICQGYPGIGHF